MASCDTIATCCRMKILFVLVSVTLAVRPSWDDHLDPPDLHSDRASSGLQTIQVITSAHVVRQSSHSHDAKKHIKKRLVPDAAMPSQGISFLQESEFTNTSRVVDQATPKSPELPVDKEYGEPEPPNSSASPDDDGEEDGEGSADSDVGKTAKSTVSRLLGDALALLPQLPKVHSLVQQGDNGERAVSLGLWLLALLSLIVGFAVSARLYSFCNRSEVAILQGCFARSKGSSGFADQQGSDGWLESKRETPVSNLHGWAELGSRYVLERFSIDRSTVADQIFLAHRLFPELLHHVSRSLDMTPSPEVRNWTAKNLADVFLFLGLHPDALKNGLSSHEATSRLVQHGRNDLEVARHTNILRSFSDALLSTTGCMVLTSALVACILLDVLHGIVLASYVIFGALVFAALERYQQCISMALVESQAMEARCLRDQQWSWLPTSELVPGDIVRVVAGERAFADLRIIAAEGLWIDESLLSTTDIGKVEKHGRVEPIDQMGGLAENIVYAQTDIVSGSGIAVVVETGMNTRVGRVFNSLSRAGGIANAATRMLLGASSWQGTITLGGPLIAICLLVNCASFLANAFLGSSDPDEPCPSDDNFCKYLRAAEASMLVAAKLMPQMLNVFCTICLAISINGFRQRGVAVRKASSMQSVGSCHSICTDMSRMLTHGSLTAVSLFSSLPDPHTFEFDEAETGRSIYLLDRSQRPRRIDEDLSKSDSPEAHLVKLALTVASLNCYIASPAEQADLGMASAEAKFEAPILTLAQQCGLTPSRLWEDFPLVMEVPFNSNTKLRVTIHAVPGGSHALSNCLQSVSYVAVVKGAPERLLPRLARGLSHKDRAGTWEICSRDPDLLQGLVESQNLRFASAALRVLLCAMLPLTQKEVSDLQNLHDTTARLDSLLQDLVFVSLLTFQDPLKEQVRPAIDACLLAGTRVVMVTGEQLGTAQAIARAIGIPGKAQIAANLRLSCGAFRPSAEIIDLCSEVCIWARAQPEEKLEISKALKELGTVCVVAAGSIDDVNVLRLADVGIALGSACSIAKNAADIVLMDDSFACLVETMEGGKQISSNLSKAVVFWLGITVGEFLAHLACAILQLPKDFGNLNLMFGQVPVMLGALTLCWEPSESEMLMHSSRDRRSRFWLSHVQTFVMWICLPLVIVSTMVLGLTLHVGVLRSHSVMDLCDYAWHPQGDSITIDTLSQGSKWRIDESPYHCKCPAQNSEGDSTEQWGRRQSPAMNIAWEFRKSSGFSGQAYAKDHGPFRNGISNVLEPCKAQLKLPRGSLCWKDQFLASAPVTLADGIESVDGTRWPLFRNLLLHSEWNCARYGVRLAKTMAWFATILSEALFLQSVRSPQPLFSIFWRNFKAVAGFCCVISLALMAMYVPEFQDALQLAPLSPKSLLLASVGPVSALALAEGTKVGLRRFYPEEFSKTDQGQARYV